MASVPVELPLLYAVASRCGAAALDWVLHERETSYQAPPRSLGRLLGQGHAVASGPCPLPSPQRSASISSLARRARSTSSSTAETVWSACGTGTTPRGGSGSRPWNWSSPRPPGSRGSLPTRSSRYRCVHRCDDTDAIEGPAASGIPTEPSRNCAMTTSSPSACDVASWRRGIQFWMPGRQGRSIQVQMPLRASTSRCRHPALDARHPVVDAMTRSPMQSNSSWADNSRRSSTTV